MPGRSPRVKFHFRARVVAAEHGCMKIRDIYRRLSGTELAISESQLGKLLRQTPRQLNLELLAALCTAFQVTPNDLLVLRHDWNSTEMPKPRKHRGGTSKVHPDRAAPEANDIKEAPPIVSLPAERVGHG